ncbi:MAG: glycogen/starch synthase [Candidatus Omnitrophica bacterium]|nr:glycogen/starch synthase [Candidatus Omnitrophota bacterium]
MIIHSVNKQTILNKIISLIMVGIFCFANVTSWADQASDSTLAPALSTQRPEFRQRFSTAGALLSENAANAYIRNQIKKLNIKPELYKYEFETKEEVLLVVIPELLVNTGQFAHIGLGRYYGEPVIYIDSEVNNYEEDRNVVLKHEIETIREFEKIRRMISQATDSEIRANEMKDEIIKYLDLPDPRLANTEYEGRTYREIEREVHAKAEPLDKVCEKYSHKVNINTEDIAGLLSLYGEDPADIYYDPKTSGSLNIAAGPRAVAEDKNFSVQDTNTKGGLGAYTGDKYEGLSAMNDKGKEPDGRSWIMDNAPDLRGKFLVTLSMEGNIPEAGDDDEAVIPEYDNPDVEGFLAMGIQPGYSHVLHDGKKIKTDYRHLVRAGVLEPVFVGKNSIKVRAWEEDPNALTLDEADNDPNNPLIKVDVYKINRGGTWCYLLMSEVFDILYPDQSLYEGSGDEKMMRGKRHRFTQEVVFGKAAFEIIKKLDRRPDILHLNEAHTVVAAALMRADKSYDNTAIVYTNHTLVPAGLERFSTGVMNTDVDRMTYVLGFPDDKREKKKFEKFRSMFVKTDRQGHVYVDFCHAAFQLADVINAVSNEHAKATVKLFKMMYGDEFNKPVIGILNGSGVSWKSKALSEWEAKAPPIAEAEDIWMDKLWDIHEENKAEAFEEIKNRTGISFDPEKLTFWAVRRLVDYKSQYPMLKFLVHLMTADRNVSFTRDELRDTWFRDISDLEENYRNNDFNTKTIVDTTLDKIFNYGARKTVNGLGAQVVVGWPPPAYEEFWASEFKRWESLPDLAGRFAAVVSDSKFLKMQGTSSDVTITSPRPLEEAAGTSDQRTALNAGVNISIKGAGPVEWMEDYDEVTEKGSGFFIGAYVNETGDGLSADSRKFYHEAPADIFEKSEIASRLFYEDGKKRWRRLMLNSYKRANKIVTARAMEERYALDAYVPAIMARQNTRIISEVALKNYRDEEHNLSGLKALQKDLPFMTAAGVKYVYLLGLMKNNGHPFEILDPKNIDNRVGSVADLKEFIDMAHQPRHGINVIMDWIANQHVAKDSDICREHPERFLYTNVSDGNYGLDREVRPYRGSSMPKDELLRRIEVGRKLNEIISSMTPDELAEEGSIEIDGRTIYYKLGDEDIREKVAGAKTPYRPVIVSGGDALFLVSATDLVSLKDKFPRRWSALAQPDLSNSDVIREAIEIGRYWLKMGVDGFRIDAAMATFADRIKKNWGIDVPVNLIATFVAEMRKIKPDCYLMMGDLERQRELLELADNKDCSAYSDECKGCMTDALTSYDKTAALLAYLRSLESVPREVRENMIYLGPEHDAFTFGDAWSNLSYQDSNIIHFLCTFLPGYQLILNGEIYGSRNYHNGEALKEPHILRPEEADPVTREVRKKIFSLPRQYRQLLDGEYHYLETDAPWHALGIARFDNDTIVIGAFNTTANDGWATFDMKRVINIQVNPLEIDKVEYIKEGMQLKGDGKTWVTVSSKKIKASDLFNDGFGVNVGPKGCEVIRLKKLPINASVGAVSKEPVKPERKGSLSKGLRSLGGADAESRIFRENAVTARTFAEMRGYSLTTVRSELNDLITLGIASVEKKGNANLYYLSDRLAMAPPGAANKAISKIIDLLETGLHIKDPARIPEKKMPLVKARVNKILDSLPAIAGTNSLGSQMAQVKDLPVSAPSPVVKKSIEEDVGRVLSLFSELAKKFNEGMTYEIRYDENRLSGCPHSEEILDAYKRLIERRMGRENKVKLIPSLGMEALISVKCYKDEKLAGEGAVDINHDVDLAMHPVRIVSLLNMAFAEAHIRGGITYDQMDYWEKGLIALIKSECKAVTGMDISEDTVREFIKNLPRVEALPIDSIEEYNRLTVLKLQQSA